MPQRRALFRHVNFQFGRSVLYILTWKCASRHNGVHFFDSSTSKSVPNVTCFNIFHLQMRFAPQRRATFHLSSGQMAPHGRAFASVVFFQLLWSYTSLRSLFNRFGRREDISSSTEPWSSVLGLPRCVAVGSEFLVLGSWFSAPGSWFLVLGSRLRVPGSWFPGSWSLVLGSWFPQPNAWHGCGIAFVTREEELSWS